MEKFAVAVKALITRDIFKDNETILVLKNSLDDLYRPGEADLPGGRLNPGEDPILGLKRELAEELGAEFANTVNIELPIDVVHFERPDGQVVTMIVYNAYVRQDAPNIDVVLSSEHSTFEWLPVKKAGHAIPEKLKVAYERFAHPVVVIK